LDLNVETHLLPKHIERTSVVKLELHHLHAYHLEAAFICSSADGGRPVGHVFAERLSVYSHS